MCVSTVYSVLSPSPVNKYHRHITRVGFEPSTLAVLEFSSVSQQQFAEQAETVFKGSDRRGDLDKAYTKLIAAQFGAIHKIALEHQKTPSDVVIFGNYFYNICLIFNIKQDYEQ